MKNEITYLHCGDYLKDTLKTEIAEVVHVVESIEWEEIFRVTMPRCRFRVAIHDLVTEQGSLGAVRNGVCPASATDLIGRITNFFRNFEVPPWTARSEHFTA